jgi:hypothetical protein
MSNSFCRALQGTAADTGHRTDSPAKRFEISIELAASKPWQKELTREERKMEHRISEQKSGFATLEQLEAWGFHADAIAECLTTQQRRLLMLPLRPANLADRRLGHITNRL